jgi:hypothetical protein
LNLNIDPKRIVIVYPNEDSKKKLNRYNCFNNPYIENVMSSVLAKLGIQVYRSHYMKQWNSGDWEPGHSVKQISFEKINSKDSDKPAEIIEFNCDVSPLRTSYIVSLFYFL